ncbi:hypothetical protein PAAG_05082 [Paracoccidioides lutzii Pb01]|uniref:Mtf2-like C-terminal domain-containing protein n=1 Tax=Paracoccidioides lutzii (strain ATCC MYA-826 / Pb01) TaxID=502779 RepID=C1H2T9_PARBA|nr:hypothetical protein PAAG_05082 [Paracoccidioides lutzii Pb01]EEH34033.1 hypothetical protein PAAG_05082 [Paracoccidioides lutzii Pb01]
MVGNLHRGFIVYQNDGIFLSFLHHTLTLTKPVYRYKSPPFPLSCPAPCGTSKRSYQSRPAQFKSHNVELPIPQSTTCSTTDLKSDTERNITCSSQLSESSSQSNLGKHYERDQNWDLLSSAIDDLKLSADYQRNEDPRSSNASEDLAQGNQSSRSSNSIFDILSNFRPTPWENTLNERRTRQAKVAQEDNSSCIDDPPEFAEDVRSRKSASLVDLTASQETTVKNRRKTNMPNRDGEKILGMQTMEIPAPTQMIDIPFENTVRTRKDKPEFWEEVDIPNRNTKGEQTIRYQGKVYSFAAGDKDELIPGMSAYGAGKLAKEVANRAVRYIIAELDDCIAGDSGDVEIWKVCEERIFAMLKLFSVEDEVIASTMPQDGVAIRHAGRKNSRKFEWRPSTSQTLDPLHIPAGIPVRPFVLHAFPETLLHALRLLHTHFPMSEITIQMYASIKARGRVARLLASDTEIYNELISYHWRVHNNLPLINSLLKDMEDHGASISSRTEKLLNSIFNQKRGMEMMSRRSSGPTLTKGIPWTSESDYRAYKDFFGIKGKREGWFFKVRKLRRFEDRKFKVTAEIHRKLPADLKGSAESEYARLARRGRGNFMPHVEVESNE